MDSLSNKKSAVLNQYQKSYGRGRFDGYKLGYEQARKDSLGNQITLGILSFVMGGMLGLWGGFTTRNFNDK